MSALTKPGLAAHLVAAAAGLAQAFSIAGWWDGQARWWLQLASLVVLVGLLHGSATVRAGALRAWTFAIAWLAGTWWWLFISMNVYGGLPAPLAAVAVLLLAAFLGLYYAAAGALYVRFAERGWMRRALLFACLWLAAELMRASLFTGFPWGAGGYAHVDGPLAGLAPVVGAYGIGFVAALVAAVIALSTSRVSRGHWRVGGVAVVLVLALALLPERAPRPASARAPLSVALLQGNIPQDEKFHSGVIVALQWYAQQLAAARTELVVTPETAIPRLPRHLPDGYLDAIRSRYMGGSATQAALVGIPLGSFEDGYTNSVLGLAPGLARAYQYDKHHLVPFGEFIPPFFKWFTRMMEIPLGDFARGGADQPSLAFKGERLAPNICYEDLFAEDLAVRFRDPAKAPTVFVNMSNIGWFGDTVAIDQHLNISRMRAKEFARPMIRATNTGATAIIDADGKVTYALPRLTRGVLTGWVTGNEAMTDYAEWLARFGLWPLWIVALGVPLLLVRRRP